jgi:hypothetical protein
MKLFSIILFTLPLFAVAQVDNTSTLSSGLQDSVLGTSLVIKASAVVFQKIYTSTLTKEALIVKLKTFLPSVKNFQLTDVTNQNADQFSGTLSGFIVNYRKYGGTLMRAPIVLNFPMNGNVIIQVKDYKYRVIISDMTFKNVQVISSVPAQDMTLEDGITSSKRTKVRTGAMSVKTAKYVNDDLSASFDLLGSNKISTEF